MEGWGHRARQDWLVGLVSAPCQGKCSMDRGQEVQDSPGILPKGSRLHAGVKLCRSGAASRPGPLPLISQGSFPI